MTSLPFDHISSPSQSDHRAVFYFSPSPSASPLLDYLEKHAAQYPSFQYIVRYRPPIGTGPRGTRHELKTPLSGFGVELALKKTDYLVVDDRATGSSPAAGQVSSTAQNVTGIFSKILGNDPWSELASPLSPAEVNRKATVLFAPRFWPY